MNNQGNKITKSVYYTRTYSDGTQERFTPDEYENGGLLYDVKQGDALIYKDSQFLDFDSVIYVDGLSSTPNGTLVSLSNGQTMFEIEVIKKFRKATPAEISRSETMGKELFKNGGNTKLSMKKIKRGGITYGPSHAEGGIPVKNAGTGEMLEVEGGEGITNKHVMASDKKVKLNGKEMTLCEAVSSINQMDGNGVKFDCDDVTHQQFIDEMAQGGELERGTRTEREHIKVLQDLYAKRITPEQATKRIAKDHIKEDKKYYTKLAKMEGKMAHGGQSENNGFSELGFRNDNNGDIVSVLEKMSAKNDNYCELNKKHCASALNYTRADMPQIYDEYALEFIKFLDDNEIESFYEYGVPVTSLKPIQKEISVKRIKKIIQRVLAGYYTDTEGHKINPLKKPLIATADGYLLDGHHRWATILFLSPTNKVDVLRIKENIKDLIDISKDFDYSMHHKYMFGGKVGIDKNIPTIALTEKFGGLYVYPLKDFFGLNTYSEKGFTVFVPMSKKDAEDGDVRLKIRDGIENILKKNFENSKWDQSSSYNSNGFISKDAFLAIGNQPPMAKEFLNGDEIFIRVFPYQHNINRGWFLQVNVAFPQSLIDAPYEVLEKTSVIDEVTNYLHTYTAKDKITITETWPNGIKIENNTGNRPSPTQSASDWIKQDKENERYFAKGNNGKWYKISKTSSGTPRWVLSNVNPKNITFNTKQPDASATSAQTPATTTSSWGWKFKSLQDLMDLGVSQSQCDYFAGKEIPETTLGYSAIKNIFRPPTSKGVFYQSKDFLETFAIPMPSEKVGMYLTKDMIEHGETKSHWRFKTEQEFIKEYGPDFKQKLSIEKNRDLTDIYGKIIPVNSNSISILLKLSKGQVAAVGLKNNFDIEVKDSSYDTWAVRPDYVTKEPLPLDSESYSGLRFKTEVELENEFGPEWRDASMTNGVGNSWLRKMDFLLGQKIPALKTKYSEQVVDALKNLNDGVDYLIDTRLLGIPNPSSNEQLGNTWIVTNKFLTTEKSPEIDTNKKYLDYRFKTKEELEKQYGVDWRDISFPPNAWISEQDFLLGQKIPNSEANKSIVDKVLSQKKGGYFVSYEKIGLPNPEKWGASDFYLTKDFIVEEKNNLTTGNEKYAGWRFKTRDEFEKEYGKLWKVQASKTILWLEDMDYLLGQKIPTNDYAKLFLDNVKTVGQCAVKTEELGIVNPKKPNGESYYTIDKNFLVQDKNPLSLTTTPLATTQSVTNINSEIETIKALLDSFDPDEYKLNGFLLNELKRLQTEKQAIINAAYFDASPIELLKLYAEKISTPQRSDIPITGCELETPNGGKSELDAIQYIIVRTPEFKNWFGDWESAAKTGDYNGVSKAINPKTLEPVIAYHGKGNMRVEATRFNLTGFPVKYFGTNLSYSKWFERNYDPLSITYEFYIKLLNPLDLTAIGTSAITPAYFVELIEALYDYKIETPLAAPDQPVPLWKILRFNPKMLKEIKANTSYDGFIMYENNPQDILTNGEENVTLDYVTYENTQSKAADNRNVTFFNDVEDIRFATGGLIKK